MADLESLVLEAKDENMEKVNEFVHRMLPPDAEKGAACKIDLAVEEIFVNIAHYAYKNSVGSAEICCGISSETDGRTLTLIFKDSGVPFNPLEQKDPDITLPAEEREIGGLGIFLTKKFMDSVDYIRDDCRNILTLRKKI